MLRPYKGHAQQTMYTKLDVKRKAAYVATLRF